MEPFGRFEDMVQNIVIRDVEEIRIQNVQTLQEVDRLVGTDFDL
jgi:hypothetical protein